VEGKSWRAEKKDHQNPNLNEKFTSKLISAKREENFSTVFKLLRGFFFEMFGKNII